MKVLQYFLRTSKQILSIPRHCNGRSISSMNIFDRRAKRRQKDRAAMAEDPSLFDYLRDAMANHVVDRVYDVSRYNYSTYIIIYTVAYLKYRSSNWLVASKPHP